MKKTSLTRALFVAGVMAMAGTMAHADAIFYPDGTHVELGANGVESGLADAVLARSPSTAPDRTTLASLGVTADQSIVMASAPMFDDEGNPIASTQVAVVDTRTLGAGPAATTSTTVTTRPVYVFPSIDWDRSTVLSQPHPMMSHLRDFPGDRSAAATFDTPTRAGEASTMTSGAPNLVTDNEVVTSVPPAVVVPNTTVLGAGSSSLGTGSTIECPIAGSCTYLPD